MIPKHRIETKAKTPHMALLLWISHQVQQVAMDLDKKEYRDGNAN
jgi:hypothetical protein